MKASTWSRLVLLFFLTLPNLFGASPPVSSPEGTLTTYVQGKNSLIYPPRSARAQKVEFDTAERQMIYEPDTPFRAFFNSHAADFAGGKLDYAKTTILGDVIASLRNKQFIRSMVKEVIDLDPDGINLPAVDAAATKEEKKAKRDRIASLLVDGITLILERENYPELRDDDIDRLLERLKKGSNTEQFDALTQQAHDAWLRFVHPDHREQLHWELRQALLEKRCLKAIIGESVARRPELFRGAGSPAGAMKDAQEQIEKFIRENLASIAVTDLSDGKKSLWEAFLAQLNDTDQRALRKTNSVDKLSDLELTAFGKAWREDLVNLLDKGTAFDKTVRETIGARRTNLVARIYDAAAMGKIAEKLGKRPAIAEAYARVKRDGPLVKPAADALNGASTESLTAEKTLIATRAGADSVVGTILSTLPRFGEARTQLNSAYVRLAEVASGQTNLSTLIDLAMEAGKNLDDETKKKTAELGPNIKSALSDLAKLKERWVGEDGASTNFLNENAQKFRAATGANALTVQRTASTQLRNPNARFTDFTKDEMAQGDGLDKVNDLATALLAVKVDAGAAEDKKKAAQNALDYGAQLKSSWSASVRESIRLRNSATGARADAIRVLTGAAINDPLKAFEDAASARTVKTDTLATLQKELDTRKATLADSIGLLTKAIEQELNALRASFPANQDFASVIEQVKSGIQATLAQLQLGVTDAIPLLNDALTAALSEVASDTSEAETRIISRMQKTFGDQLPLLRSDDPILKAYLKSGKVTFPNADFAKKAADQIASKFKTAIAKVSPVTLDAVISSLKAVLEDPDTTYLFGNGDANAKAMEAFKGEFFNAFKHRLPEALLAERDADYDYWWLSFYPKAVPVGANQFQGQSILEVGFSENIVPVEQYHRWLEDQQLGKDSKESEFEHRNRLAAGVLNDFLAALDSSALSDRFPEVREKTQKALAILSERPSGRETSPMEIRYRRAMAYLIDEAQKTDELHSMKLKGTALIADTRSIALALKIKGASPSDPRAGIVDPMLTYFNCAKQLFGDTNSSAFSDLIHTNALKAFEEEARRGLEWQDMDIRHIAFATLTASLNNAALPAKVGLLCSAFWGGSRRFSTDLTDADEAVLHRTLPPRFAKLPSDTYLVPFEDAEEQAQLARYLLLRGVSSDGAGLLLKRYRRFITQSKVQSNSTKTAPVEISAETVTNIAASVAHEVASNFVTKNASEVASNVARNVVENTLFPLHFEQLTLEPKKEDKTNETKEAWLERLIRSTPTYYTTDFTCQLWDYKKKILLAESNRLDSEITRVESEKAKLECEQGVATRMLSDEKELAIKELAARYRKRRLLIEAQADAAKKRLIEVSGPAQEEQRRIATNLLGILYEGIRRDLLIMDDEKDAELTALEKKYEALQLKAKSREDIKDHTATLKKKRGELCDTIKRIQDIDKPCPDGSCADYLKCTNKEGSSHCAQLELTMETLAQLSAREQCDLSRQFFRGIAYDPDRRPSVYLAYPVLWPLEQSLDRTRERLRSIVVHLYQSEYPSIPDATRIQSDFLKKDTELKSVIYQWLRELYVYLLDENLLNESGDPDVVPATRVRQVKVMGNLLLDQHPYLTHDSRRELLRIFVEDRSIYDWLEEISANQQIMDQLRGHLLQTLYKPVFSTLEYLNKVERQSVPFTEIAESDYIRFRNYSKPRQQKGIQIVELLPVSRDDLVSMSVNEGGVVAKIAGQVEGSAAYDMNQLQTVLRNAQLLGDRFRDVTAGLDSGPAAGTNAVVDLSDSRSLSQAKSFNELSKLSQGSGISGYSLGATAQGSIYGRAKSALAYSRRREYLDAVITSAGMGDNFAKWVIRPSDLRSELAQKGGKKLVAAKHSGFPNGDQPFYMLVKVPRNAIHADWGGRKYIYFNSAYSATGRQSFWRDFGWPGLLVKTPFTIINHNMWHKMEETMVTSVYPFMWNVPSRDASDLQYRVKALGTKAVPDPWFDASEKEMLKVGRTANALGGEILLDDTDKIRYSEIRTLLDAEADFIQLTRTAQLSDLNKTMDDVQKEAGSFRGTVVTNLQERFKATSELQKSQAETAKLKEKQDELEAKFKKLQEDFKALPK